MRSLARSWSADSGWDGRPLLEDAALVMVFGDRLALSNPRVLEELAELHPGAERRPP